MHAPAELATRTWRMRWTTNVRSQPGTLRLAGGRLSWTAAAGGPPLFDVGLDEVRDVRFPRLNLGTVVRLTIDGQVHRFSFVAYRTADREPVRELLDVRGGRRRGRAWRTALGR